MRLKLFRAPTVAAAMAQVRAELGDDALILATRRVGTGVELTAALEPGAPPALATPPDPGWLEGLRWHGVPSGLAARLGQGDVAAALARHLRFAPLDLAAGAPPILLAGPPGAGKTLTTARLATRLVLQGTLPLVISADGERAGAAEQLAAFTRLLGLVLIVAPDPVGIAHALARREGGAPVLIDAPGIDPFSASAQAGIAGLAAAAGAHTALVLPAGQDPAEAADAAAAFAAAGAGALVVTRLDVARRLGSVLAAAASLPLAEAGIGPGAADGLVPLTPALLAARLAVTPTRKAA
jgi:flagellar biosynthesis protein FlhF